MANTYVDYTGDNSETDFIFNFDYLQDDHVKVKVNDVIVTNYSIVEVSADNVIRFDTAPASNASIRIYRDSRGDFSPLVDFVDGSVLTGDNLDEAYKHNLFVSQEASEGTGNELLNKKGGANYDAEGNKIINLGTPTDSTDAANKGYVDQTIDNSIALGGSPAIVSLGGYDVTDITGSLTQSLANWTAPTATGSTTARSLADRFADVVNVLDYIPASQHTYILGNNLSSQDGSLVTTGIQNAFNAGFDVFIPRGIYKISSTLTIPTQSSSRKKPMFIYGTAGNPNIETQNISTLAFEGSGACIDGVNGLDNQSRICIKDLAIYIPGYTKTAGTVGIDLQQPVNTSVENVCIAGFDIGIQGVDGFWYSTYRRLRIFNCNIGFRIEGASGTNSDGSAKGGANGMTIAESFFSTCGYGLFTRYTTEQLNIVNCTIEASTTNSIYSEFFRQINITNCYFEEACSGNIIRGVREENKDSQLNLTGNNFQADIGGTSIVFISNASNEDFKVNAKDQYLFLKSTATASYFLGSNSTATKLYMPTPIQQYEGTGSKLLTGIQSGGSEVFSIDQDDVINIGTNLKFGNLDFEYEEGTWTPVLNIAGGANAHTYAIQDGSYIKAGQQVTVTFRLTINSVDPGTGDVSIGGLPFTTVQSAAGVAFSLISGITLTSPYTSVLGQADGSTDITLHKLSNGGYAVVQNADVGSSCFLMGTMTYITN